MTKGVEKIYKGKVLAAIVVRNSVKPKGTTFFTSEFAPLQVGLQNKEKSERVSLHYHKLGEGNLNIKEAHEVLFVKTGRIRLTLTTKSGNLIAKKILKKGDLVVIGDTAHEIAYLENSMVLEIKQGPHIERLNKKIFVK